MHHLKQCRTNLKEIFPNYGSDCTCGSQHLFNLVENVYEFGVDAIVDYLQESISWTMKFKQLGCGCIRYADGSFRGTMNCVMHNGGNNV